MLELGVRTYNLLKDGNYPKKNISKGNFHLLVLDWQGHNFLRLKPGTSICTKYQNTVKQNKQLPTFKMIIVK